MVPQGILERDGFLNMADDLIESWFNGLASDGGAQAAQQLWEQYYERLIGLARKKLGSGSRRVMDEEDVVVSAFRSFCSGMEKGRYSDLADPHDLWKLLVTITLRKAVDQLRFQGRLKRGGGRIRGESALPGDADADIPDGLNQVLGREPTPEFAALVAEECEKLLERLDNDQRQIAILRMENYTEAEIAQRLQCSLSTVKRRLRIIRELSENREDS